VLGFLLARFFAENTSNYKVGWSLLRPYIDKRTCEEGVQGMKAIRQLCSDSVATFPAD
jgi:hypothetical protein